jgi:hypothetical protein
MRADLVQLQGIKNIVYVCPPETCNLTKLAPAGYLLVIAHNHTRVLWDGKRLRKRTFVLEVLLSHTPFCPVSSKYIWDNLYCNHESASTAASQGK